MRNRFCRSNAICPGSVSGDRIDAVIEKDAMERGVPGERVRDVYLRQTSMRTAGFSDFFRQRHERALERTFVMPVYTRTPHNSSRNGKPFNPGQRHRANFARAAVFAGFGYHHGRAIDYAEFVDRRPDQAPMPAPGAQLKW